MILGGGIGGVVIRQGANVGIPAAFLHFTRKDESEADYLGVQYLYAAGYDPNGAISIFEKLESLERKQPGTVARIFSTHPMDATRIQKTEEEIGRILPAKDEYVVNTSEYTAIRERLISQEARKKGVVDDGRPQLRRRVDPVEQTAEQDRADGAAAGFDRVGCVRAALGFDSAGRPVPLTASLSSICIWGGA